MQRTVAQHLKKIKKKRFQNHLYKTLIFYLFVKQKNYVFFFIF